MDASGNIATPGSIAFGTNPGDAGPVRLENNTCINWEIATPGTDKCLKVNASDQLDFNGTINLSGTTTGSVVVSGATSGSLTITTADATAQAITITGAAQTSGATVLTIPDRAGSNGTFAFTTGSNVATATALAANGANCTGEVALGVTAAGVCEGTATPTLGTAGSVVGTLAFANATSGTITVSPPTGALGTVTVSLPAATDTLMGKATTDVMTNKTLDAEGTGNVLTIPRRIWLPAAGCNNVTAGSIWDLPTANAPEALCKTYTSTQKGVLAFDATTDESAQVHYLLPSTWTGTVDARIFWYSATITDPVAWCVQLVAVAAGELDDVSFPAQATGNCVSSAAAGTTLQMNIATITGATITGVAASELLHIQISRDPNETSTRTDTSATDAFLVGVELTIREAI
jgi:hypothetical protein